MVKQTIKTKSKAIKTTESSAKTRTNTKPGKRLIGAVVLSAGLIGAAGFGIGQMMRDDEPITSFTPVYTITQDELNSAKSLLGRLQVLDEATEIPDYKSEMMPTWIDIDMDGCVTRYDILERDILDGKTNNQDCKVISGKFFDYYSGTLVEYNSAVSGGGIDIDHIVAKEDAWNSGGFSWSAEQWQAYINDENLLIATSASANRQKGGKNAAKWLPQNTDFHCRYVIMQIQIKHEYQLGVTVSEKAVLKNILNNLCIVR